MIVQFLLWNTVMLLRMWLLLKDIDTNVILYVIEAQI